MPNFHLIGHIWTYCIHLFGHPVPACIAGYRVAICFAGVLVSYFKNDFCQPNYHDFHWMDFHAVFTVRFRYGLLYSGRLVHTGSAVVQNQYLDRFQLYLSWTPFGLSNCCGFIKDSLYSLSWSCCRHLICCGLVK